MSTFHKCDKCGKIIKGSVVDFSFADSERNIFVKYYNQFEFYKTCVKPLAIYVNGFLAKKNSK
ncbi:hypothetical protein A3H09_03435 [Candidatus Falkowbacteria bacterium RIFCSPLOWO2_12_FULL_45_13]|uniref:Uncharacterized protein n=2 Tax=Candidatus Falkowiibacteriota TaxID=1752728 RepID=A0A1F5SC34_9BACT|nr:MAG: hypothetical protein A3H66_02390 [Candidatus Falkowbacteria bacterium RIFCSPLOWO2_02_FULL_45_21]OGF32063.1 MAG: hypothetical protein A3H09_03435 [Candidatus Falkowbacteria bacterium RIFCSPLOWO2_12_FULL_45_13]